MLLVPNINEELYAFDMRFDTIHRHINSSWNEEHDRIPESIYVRRYQDILKEFFGSMTMSRFLEPYYLKQSSDRHLPLPKSIADFRDHLRSTLKAAKDVSNVPIRLTASKTYVSSIVSEDTVAAAAALSNPPAAHPNPPTPQRERKCLYCNGKCYESIFCKIVDQDLQDILQQAHRQVKSALADKRKKSVGATRPWDRGAKKVNALVVENNDENLLALYPAKQVQFSVSTVIVVVAAMTLIQGAFGHFQIDNGANASFVGSLELYEETPVDSNRTYLGVHAGQPMKLGKVGKTVFGIAYLNPTSRNILAVCKLTQEGFSVTYILGENGRDYTACLLEKGKHQLRCNAIDGLFYASYDEVKEFATKVADEHAVVAVTTRGNPFGIPNDTQHSTAMEPIIENESVDMDIEDTVALPDEVTYIEPTEDAPYLEPSTKESVPEHGDISQVSDKAQDIAKTTASPVPTTDPTYCLSLKRHLTLAEQQKQVKAALLHAATGHAGKATEKLLLDGGHLMEPTLFPKDMDIYHEMKGACLGCLKGKMTMPPSIPWTIRTGALIGEYWEMDLGFFGGHTYAVLVEVVTNYTVVYRLQNRNSSSLAHAAQQWNNLLRKSFPQLFQPGENGAHTMIKMKTDRENAFKTFESAVNPLVLDRTSAEGHASRVEVAIRIIKERARSVMYSLPYKLPALLFDRLINYVVDIKNFLPSTLKSSHTAWGQVHAKKIKESDLLRLQFGLMVATIVPPNQRGPKVEAVANEGIIVGFERHSPHNLIIYNIATRSFVVREKVVAINSPALLLALNNMASEDMTIDPFPLNVESSDSSEPIVVASVEGGLPSTSHIPVGVDYSTLDNMNMHQATNKFGAEHVLQSTLVELDNMFRMNVFTVIDPKDIDPKGSVMPSKIFYKAKTKDGVFDKLKARWVCRGDLQPAGSYGETKSPTADKSSLFLLCALNKVIKGNIYSVDVPAAFLFAKLQENLNMRLPKEITPLLIKARPEFSKMLDKHGRITVKLMKSLYGLKQSPLNWFHHLVAVLEEAGFIGCITDRCVFFRKDKHGITHLLFHVDDLFVSSNAGVHMAKLRQTFANAFGKMEWAERSFTFLGMYFSLREDYSIDVDMVAYTTDLLKRHWTPDIGAEFKKTRGIINPSTDNLFHEVDLNLDATAEQISAYKSVSMELLYLTPVRIDILKECVVAAGQSHAPGPRSWKLIRQLIAYLKENPALVINLGADSTQLTMYADAGYAQHPDASSHTGIFLTLGTNAGPILVKSKRQNLVTSSSTEAELLALVDGIKRGIALAKLLVELRLNNNLFILAMQDNTSTITIALAGEGMNGKAKHFLVRFHFLRQLLDQGIMDIKHEDTENMIPDYMTKGMTGVKFQLQIIRGMYHGDLEAFKNACRNAFERVMGKMINVN
jgi:hypothetical protein